MVWMVQSPAVVYGYVSLLHSCQLKRLYFQPFSFFRVSRGVYKLEKQTKPIQFDRTANN